jgi:hypothetical protein
MKRLIRCIVTRRKEQPRERWFTLAALGGNIQALERTYAGTIELADPSLTDAEAKSIAHNFPYAAIEAVTEPQPVAPPKWDEETELRAMLDTAKVKHGRVKRIEKLREMVAELS